MICYKGFNKDLACTMGKGIYQYKIGETYKEKEADCARTGFHCVEEPIEVLRWYSKNVRFCIVEAKGDISEDGDERIACTEMKLIKEITLEQLGVLECEWIINHPDRKCSSKVEEEKGVAGSGEIVVVRGKNPKAAGAKGTTVFLLKEKTETKEIEEAAAYTIDGDTYKENMYYNVEGRTGRCRKKN